MRARLQNCFAMHGNRTYLIKEFGSVLCGVNLMYEPLFFFFIGILGQMGLQRKIRTNTYLRLIGVCVDAQTDRPILGSSECTYSMKSV